MTNDNLVHSINKAIPEDLCQFIIESFEESNNLMQGIVGGGLNTNIKSSTDLMITGNLDNPKWVYIYDYLRENLLYYLIEYVRANPFIFMDSKFSSEISLIRSVHGMFTASNMFRPHMQMQRYISNDGFYTWHHEWSEETNSGMNFRQLFFIYYLNTVDGGSTDFAYNKMSAMPEVGKLLIAPAFWTHKHKGNPPGEGKKKYIITGWIEIDRKNHIREEFVDDYFK